MYYPEKIKGNKTSVLIIIFMFIMIIPSAIILITTTTNPVYGQPDMTSLNVTELIKLTKYSCKKSSGRGY